MNNDLISRSALLKRFGTDPYFSIDPNDRRIFEILTSAPAVDAEVVRHGKWGRFGKTHHRIVCSACKFPTPFKKQANGYHLAWKSNYCPNCGAKMEQVDD